MDSDDIFLTADAQVADIQNAIDTAPPGATVHLAAGTYVFRETLEISRSDVTLLGAGTDQTTIIASTALGSAPAIQVGHALFLPNVVSTYDMAQEAVAGSQTIRLETGHDVQPGDHLYLSQDNTPSLFEAIGDTAWQREDSDLRTFLVEVTAVNGASLALANPLPFDFDPALTDVEHRAVVEDTTLSGFTLRGAWGHGDPGDFSNTAPDALGSSMIVVAGTSGVALTDIAIQDAASHGVTLAASTGLTITDLSVDGAMNKGSGGNGYGIWIRDVYDSTMTGLEVTDTRHAVLFASYTSATGNTLDVRHTNRDINLHGGLDQDNTIHVHSSVREGAEIDYLAPVFFINDQGAHYGAPTDPDANSVTFQTVRGTVRAEFVVADDSGVDFELYAGADYVVSGDGHDRVDLGTGHDIYIASNGHDTVQGGSGQDTAVFAFGLNNYATWWQDDTVFVSNAFGTTQLSRVETLSFGGQLYAADEIGTTEILVSEQFGATGGAGLTVIEGASGWERESSWVSAQMGDALNAIVLNGAGDLDAFGNDLANHMLGNGGQNRLEGGAGHDRLVGLLGNDLLFGGDGSDALFGGHDADTLVGGDGDDLLYGGAGADLFVASAGTNRVQDFDPSQGDQIAFNADPSFATVFEQYQQGAYTGGAYDFDKIGEDLRITSMTGESILISGFDLIL